MNGLAVSFKLARFAHTPRAIIRELGSDASSLVVECQTEFTRVAALNLLDRSTSGNARR